jgi:hypothetical protein
MTTKEVRRFNRECRSFFGYRAEHKMNRPVNGTNYSFRKPKRKAR